MATVELGPEDVVVSRSTLKKLLWLIESDQEQRRKLLEAVRQHLLAFVVEDPDAPPKVMRKPECDLFVDHMARISEERFQSLSQLPAAEGRSYRHGGGEEEERQ